MKRSLLAAAAAVLAIAAPVQANDDLTGLSRELAQCAGFYYASADLMREFIMSDDDVLLIHNLGNGASIASHWALVLLGWDPREAYVYTDDNVQNNRAEWRSRLRRPDNPAVVDQRNRCLEIQSQQATLVEQSLGFVVREQGRRSLERVP